tara:strand:+ start:414 stop:557 length:144 start_codon:yes stop_codon:yes gene_type:complete
MTKNTKAVTITLTKEQQDNARALSKELFGKENISGYIGYLIGKAKRD